MMDFRYPEEVRMDAIERRVRLSERPDFFVFWDRLEEDLWLALSDGPIIRKEVDYVAGY